MALDRTSAVTVTNWRVQKTAVYSISRPTALSTLSTVLNVPPPRDPLSPFIPRSSSLAFHPREMLYAVGSLDGSGELTFTISGNIRPMKFIRTVRVMGCKLPS